MAHILSSELWSMFHVTLAHSKIKNVYLHVLGNADKITLCMKIIMSHVCITHSNSKYRSVCLQSGQVQYH